MGVLIFKTLHAYSGTGIATPSCGQSLAKVVHAKVSKPRVLDLTVIDLLPYFSINLSRPDCLGRKIGDSEFCFQSGETNSPKILSGKKSM
jgi:hypothetical protein